MRKGLQGSQNAYTHAVHIPSQRNGPRAFIQSLLLLPVDKNSNRRNSVNYNEKEVLLKAGKLMVAKRLSANVSVGHRDTK